MSFTHIHITPPPNQEVMCPNCGLRVDTVCCFKEEDDAQAESTEMTIEPCGCEIEVDELKTLIQKGAVT